MLQTLPLQHSTTPMMASAETTKARTTIGAGGLHTPQEPTLDSFTQTHEEKVDDATSLLPVQTIQTHSPPASPEFRPTVTPVNEAQDPPLFAEQRHDSQQEEAPLFDSDGDIQVGDAPTSPAQQEKTEKAEEAAQQPDWQRRLDARFGPGVKNIGGIVGPSVYIHPSPEGAYAYWYARMQEVYRIRAAQQLPKPVKSPAPSRDPETARQLRLVDQSAKVHKSRSPQKAAVKPHRPLAERATPSRAASPAESAEVAEVAVRPSRRSRTPKVKATDEFGDDGMEKKHKRAPPSKQTASKEEDVRWRSMPNYAPAIPTDGSETYKVTWKQSSRLDNSTEADYDELTQAEKDACAVLRLKPVQWLSNKRRIFLAKTTAVKEGEKFTKTKAQVASNIDVNKTTQMFEAFERMGWMENAWFEQFVGEV